MQTNLILTLMSCIFLLSSASILSYPIANAVSVDRYWTVLTPDRHSQANTSATGFVGVKFREDFKQLVYNVNVNNIDNITGIKLYSRADDTKNRTMILDLLKEAKEVKVKDTFKKTIRLLEKTSQIEGTVAVGGVTAKDLHGELKNKSLKALHKLLINGDTYVRITTKQFPHGEIRGGDFVAIDRFFPDTTDFRWD
jgi:CHRD domain-containing protein